VNEWHERQAALVRAIDEAHPPGGWSPSVARETLRALVHALHREGEDEQARRVALVAEEPLSEPRSINQLQTVLGLYRFLQLQAELGIISQ
jgi:hypothetical protein